MTQKSRPSPAELLAAERYRLTPSAHGSLRIAVGYPNTYRVGMSSLAYQWVIERTAALHDVGVERFFADPDMPFGRSFENSIPLGNFAIVAFSCSFELDAVNLLRCLERAGIPMRSEQRRAAAPLIVVGGAVASINPLPLAPAVDVFCLGAAERVWPELIARFRNAFSRKDFLADIAERDGFFVPSRHLDACGEPRRRVRRLEKRDAHMADRCDIPVSHVVTPHTEYGQRGLVEISRGCPEKCRYCWVSHNSGRLRTYPASGIIERLEEIGELIPRVGLVATAVGDHPDLPWILAACRDRGYDVAISSLRIPAMVPEVLEPLVESGARSITIAPETGSDRLRRLLNKAIPNAHILAGIERAAMAGIRNLKMYFIVGLPGEELSDVDAIADLVREASALLQSTGRRRGSCGIVHVGVSLLVPKPYTPFARERVLSAGAARRSLGRLGRSLARLPGVRFTRPSHREALWQAFLSRSGTGAFELLGEMARGTSIAQTMARHRAEIERLCGIDGEGLAPPLFISSSPHAKRQ